MQTSLSRLAKLQEQLSTGRVLNRPSDSPTDTTSAMRIRSSITDVKQFARNAQDGNGWLTTIDAALTTATDQVLRARDLALQGANQAVAGQRRAGRAGRRGRPDPGGPDHHGEHRLPRSTGLRWRDRGTRGVRRRPAPTSVRRVR